MAVTMPKDAKELFDVLIPQGLKQFPDKAREVNAIYAFKITGDGGGEWTVDLTSNPPTIVKGDSGTVPMTWGVLQPVVWLPADAEEWDDERRSLVLTHELAHVRRRDALTQWIAHLALVVNWFNPLAWIAVKRVRDERERACDDAVLELGARPTSYADHLLDIVRSHGTANGPMPALAMARRSQFEGRLLAILQAAQSIVPEGPSKLENTQQLAHLADDQKDLQKAIEQKKRLLRQNPDDAPSREKL